MKNVPRLFAVAVRLQNLATNCDYRPGPQTAKTFSWGVSRTRVAMADLNVHQRCLVRARETLGGLEGLARYLHVSPSSASAWLEGQIPLPDLIFLRVIDLLLDEVNGLEDWNRLVLASLSDGDFQAPPDHR